MIQHFVSEMVLQCFNWIMHIFNASGSGGLFSLSISSKGCVVAQLPDDIVMDILSRIPAERVVECRRVCENWRKLIDSQDFTRLHLCRATTQYVLFQPMYYGRKDGKLQMGMFIYDPTIEKINKLKKLRLRPGILTRRATREPLVSCDGLILFLGWASSSCWFIFNPVTQEQMAITLPDHAGRGYVCGFFYHPSIKKYKILFRLYFPNKYVLYTLGDLAWRSIQAKPLGCNPANNRNAPAIVNGSLFWVSEYRYENLEEIPPCTRGIVMFDINTEEFSVQPHPGKECPSISRHEHMSLLASEERNLLFTYLGYIEKYMDIWILEDYSSWTWVKKWKLDLKLLEQLDGQPWYTKVKLLHSQNGQLMLHCPNRGLFLYQHDDYTVKKLQGTPPCEPGRDLHYCIFFTKSHYSLHRLFSAKFSRNIEVQIHDDYGV